MSNTYCNGTFRKKKGFTMASNSVIRNSSLSLKAKGLYTLIQSYITCESLEVTKAFLIKQCTEGEKAFDGAWNELKRSGYLKIHLYPAEQGRFRYEYELLDEADLADGIYLYRYNTDGHVTSTNMTDMDKIESKERAVKEKEHVDDTSCKKTENDHHPQKGGSGRMDDHHPQNGGGGEKDDHTPHFRGGGKGGGNIILDNNTNNNIYNLSINQVYREAETLFKKQIDYDGWKDEGKDDKELLNLIVRTAVELMTMPEGHSWRIHQIQRSASEIRSQISKLRHEHIEYIMLCIKKSQTPINNISAFIRTSLYNAPDTYSLYKAKKDKAEKTSSAKEQAQRPAGRFHNFNQRSYDYSAMEVEFVQKLHASDKSGQEK